METGLLRNPEVIRNNLINNPNDPRVFCKKEMEVYFPVSFTESGITKVKDTVETLGFVMLAMGNIYSVLKIIANVTLTPTEIGVTELFGEKYYKLSFEAGSCVFENQSIVVKDTLIYTVYNEFFSRGNVPAYLDYDDILSIFDTAQEYAGVDLINGRNEIFHLIGSMISRNKKNLVQYYRQIADSPDADKLLRFVSMNDIDLNASNAVNKLGGNYFQTGVVSALNNPSTEIENIESILRY